MPKKGEGLKPGADPTAPGGMSQQALVDELLDKHGWKPEQVEPWRTGSGKKTAWDLAAWNDMIHAVVQARLDREGEQGIGPRATDETRAKRAKREAEAVEAEVVEVAELTAEPEPDDLDILMAEVAAERAAYLAENPPLLVKIPGVKDYIFNGHMGAGPSASERWINCTGSLELSRKFLETLSPEQQAEFSRSNTAARQGTTAHAAAEAEALVALGRMDETEADNILTELALEPAAGEEYDEEMGEHIAEYVDLVKAYAHDRGAEAILIEERVTATIPLTGDHDRETYDIRGSADFIALPVEKSSEPTTLVVVDLKYGAGVDVEVQENSQARIYALGAVESMTDEEGYLTTDTDKIRYYIAQPRLGGIKVWEESLDDLLDWRDDVLAPALTAALYGQAGGATLTPSEVACQWCPARGICPALTEQRVAEAAELFDAVLEAEVQGKSLDIEALDDERLGTLLSQITGLMDLSDDLKAEAQRRLHRGGRVPGFKLVSYTPPRRWKDGVEQVFSDDAPVWKPRSLISPTQALKLLGKNEKKIKALSKWIETPDKKPVIAREGDRRKTWDGNDPDRMFTNLDEEG